MEEKIVKKKRSPFDIPYLGATILFVIGELLIQAVAMIGGIFFQEDNTTSRTVLSFVSAVVGLLILILYRVFTHKKYRGGLRGDSLKDWKFWIMIIVIFLFDSGTTIYDIVSSGFAGISLMGVSMSLMAGLCEEAVFRSMMISNMMRCYKGKANYWPALIFSAGIFGCFHFINLTQGANFWMTVIQVIFAIGMGFMFGAIFLRTGNILYTIVFHTLHDFLCSLALNQASGIMTANPTWVQWVECAITLVVSLGATLLLLKGKKQEICQIWDERWTPKEADTAPEAK